MAKLPSLKPMLTAADTRCAAPQPKGTDPIYSTPEHAAWRAKVIARAGGACQCCGRTGGRLFADHIVELRDGGAPFDVANGQALCGACHSRKTAAARAERQRTAAAPQGPRRPAARHGGATVEGEGGAQSLAATPCPPHGGSRAEETGATDILSEACR